MMESYGEMRRLTDYAAAQIERLKADGVQLAPESVLTIAAIGRLVESPSARLDLSRGRPVHIGGAVLWPLTLAGSDWFTRHQDALGSQQLCGLAYAMAHGREPLPESDVFKNVKRWSASLRCRVKELDEACQQVLAQDEQPAPANESDGGQTFGDLSAILTATCGGPPENVGVSSIHEVRKRSAYPKASNDGRGRREQGAKNGTREINGRLRLECSQWQSVKSQL